MSTGGRFTIGQKVRWSFRQTWFEGIVTAVVSAGVIPEKVGKSIIPRDHESYVVTAQRLNSRAQRHGPVGEHWPKAELLRRA